MVTVAPLLTLLSTVMIFFARLLKKMAVSPAGNHSAIAPAKTAEIFQYSLCPPHSGIRSDGTTTSTSLSTEQRRLQGKAPLENQWLPAVNSRKKKLLGPVLRA
jgi:hypothetical protein